MMAPPVNVTDPVRTLAAVSGDTVVLVMIIVLVQLARITDQRVIRTKTGLVPGGKIEGVAMIFLFQMDQDQPSAILTPRCSVAASGATVAEIRTIVDVLSVSIIELKRSRYFQSWQRLGKDKA